ncbi:MAG: hypothetical protein ABWY05_00070 [Noviherbaspirillum sp.]
MSQFTDPITAMILVNDIEQVSRILPEHANTSPDPQRHESRLFGWPQK